MFDDKILDYKKKLDSESWQGLKSNDFKIITLQPNYFNFPEQEKLPLALQKIAFSFKYYFLTHLRFIYNHGTTGAFWLAYEIEKPMLWSYVPLSLIKSLIHVKLQYEGDPILKSQLIDFIILSLEKNLHFNLNFEKLSFDIMLKNNQYINIKTKEIIERFEPTDFCLMSIEYNKKLKSEHLVYTYIVLDGDSTINIEDQTSFYWGLLKNKTKDLKTKF